MGFHLNNFILGPPIPYPEDPVRDTTDRVTTAVHNFNIEPPESGFTENRSLMASVATQNPQNPCVDYFFLVVVPDSHWYYHGRPKKAWSHDSLTTLKLLCNLLDIRGTGKSDKERFYSATLWLHKHHPKTLASNVGIVAKFGDYKVLLEILYILLEGENASLTEKKNWKAKKGRSRGKIKHDGNLVGKKPEKISLRSRIPREMRIELNETKLRAQKAVARAKRKEKLISKAVKVIRRYKTDLSFRFLHDSIAEVFAKDLRQDMELLKSNHVNKISLASKWCPSVDSLYDQATLISESIARRVFPRESDPEFESLEEEKYVYRIKDRLRKQVLGPLRKALELPEVHMSLNNWETLPYKGLPSAARTLLPYEIIDSLKHAHGGKVAELQWKSMVENTLKLGRLTDCIAISAPGYGMEKIPMKVSVSLGLLISELSKDPWKGKLITFSDDPQICQIEGNTLSEKAKFIREMDKVYCTSFQKVFEAILSVAIEGKLSEDQMVKKIFVFSDSPFEDRLMYRNYWNDFERDDNKRKGRNGGKSTKQ